MKEINFNCPHCMSIESIYLEKRTISATVVPIGKKKYKYYSCLSDDNDHIPVDNCYEQYVLVCDCCSFEFVIRESQAFDELDEEIDINLLVNAGVV